MSQAIAARRDVCSLRIRSILRKGRFNICQVSIERCIVIIFVTIAPLQRLPGSAWSRYLASQGSVRDCTEMRSNLPCSRV